MKTENFNKTALPAGMAATASAAYAIPGLKQSQSAIRVNHLEQCLAIRQRVCDYFEVTPEQLAHKSRLNVVTQPRQIAMYLSATRTKLPLKQIGKLYGNRDHTTVIHARDTVSDEIGTGSELDCCLREILMGVEKRVRQVVVPISPKPVKDGPWMPEDLVEKIMSLRERGHSKTYIRNTLRLTEYTVNNAISLARKHPEAYTY